MPGTSRRAAVCSRSPLRLAGLTSALAAYPGIDVVGSASEVAQLVEVAERTGADGLFVDLQGVDEDEVLELREVVLGQARSIVFFGRAPRQVRQAASEFAYVAHSRTDLATVVAALDRPPEPEVLTDARRAWLENLKLTPREHEVLISLARGCTTAETAAALEISSKTVDVHRRNLYAKLGARSQGEAVTLALSRQIINPSELL